MLLQPCKFGGRDVLLGEPSDKVEPGEASSFVVLAPARYDEEVEEVLSIAKDWVRAGCKEICCVGTQAELLHDRLDQALEDSGSLGVITTWHEDPYEACEYFLFGAGAQRLVLCALIARWPELVNVLLSVSQGE